jgi:hypothetical protein
MWIYDRTVETKMEPRMQPKDVYMLLVEAIDPGVYQPRKDLREEDTSFLESIKKWGVLEPILVRKKGERYELIGGNRRYAAAVKLKLKEIPARVLEVGEKEAWWVAVVENQARKDFSIMEKLLILMEALKRDGVEDPEGFLKNLYWIYQTHREKVIKEEDYKRLTELGNRLGLNSWTVITTYVKLLILVPDPQDRELLARIRAKKRVIERWKDPAFRDKVLRAYAEGKKREEHTMIPGELYAMHAARRRERGTATLRRALEGAVNRLKGRAKELALELIKELDSGSG